MTKDFATAWTDFSKVERAYRRRRAEVITILAPFIEGWWKKKFGKDDFKWNYKNWVCIDRMTIFKRKSSFEHLYINFRSNREGLRDEASHLNIPVKYLDDPNGLKKFLRTVKTEE